jgi:hypothetical protein
MTVYAEDSLNVSTATDTKLTAAKFNVNGGAKATKVRIAPRGASIFYNFLSTPNSTNGFRLAADQELEIAGYDNIKNFKARSQSGSGTLFVAYYN